LIKRQNLAAFCTRFLFNFDPKPDAGVLPVALTKEVLVQRICWATDLRKCDAAKTVETLLEIVKSTLASGEDVLITGFGKFCAKDKGKRRGRNPHSGQDLMLAERRVVTFKCSTVLKRKLNGGE
jgi:integration host factor subunit alpha